MKFRNAFTRNCFIITSYVSFLFCAAYFLTLQRSDHQWLEEKTSYKTESNEIKINHTVLPECPASFSGRFFLNLEDLTGAINNTFLEPVVQGHWAPRSCRPVYKPIAVIVPYRNRNKQLGIFLNRMHAFLQQQKLEYWIIVVEQSGVDSFNRGLLFNVGFLHAPAAVDCFIFADVDLIPELYDNLYTCNENLPKHISTAVSTWNYRLPYPSNFGGVVAIKRAHFVRINGYSTMYWGWGGEDDDLYRRCLKKFQKVDRVECKLGRTKHLWHTNNERSPKNPIRVQILNSKYNYDNDGLNNTMSICSVNKTQIFEHYIKLQTVCKEPNSTEILSRLKLLKHK